jgi:hypothetical protein
MSFRLPRRLALLFLSLLGTYTLSAQSYTLKIQFTDASTEEKVAGVAVAISKAGSETVEKFSQTDENGQATLTGIAAGKYTLKGILLGYETFEEAIEVKKNTDLGVRKLIPEVNQLAGAVVSDIGNPITVKKDTIEHNVAIMKTSDSDVLEDLLKRLPGIEVGSDGSITSNGKTISKVYIDGKTFFLDDPKLATKNLPAKIVNKVRVVNKKSEQAEFTGIDDGDEETVLDLSIKKGMMNGWMGNLTGGIGSDLRGKDADGNPIDNDLRFQGGGMLAKFTENDQIVVLGNANNTNNRGFNDITGDAMGGMRGGGMRGGNNGISTSYMLGLNGTKSFQDKSELNGNYLFNANLRAVEEMTDRTVFKEDGSSLNSVNKSQNLTNTYGHRAGARIDWKISKQTSILFTPWFNYGWGDFSEVTEYATTSYDGTSTPAKVNDGNSVSTGNNRNMTTGGRLLWRQRIGSTAGRTFSVMTNYNISNSTLDGYNLSQTNTYTGGALSGSKDVDQYYDQSSRSANIGSRLTYTEPLGGNFFAEANYRINYTWNRSVKDTYTPDANDDYTVFDDDYSSAVTNVALNQRVGLSLKKQENKYNITVGGEFIPSRTVSNTTIGHTDLTPFDRTVYNWAPNARIDLNFSDNHTLRINYRGRTQQPSVSQLQPVPDNSNPQYVRLGNPNLTPSFSHNLNTDYHLTNMETFASLNSFFNLTYTTNNIVSAAYYGPDGVQYTIPMNNDKGLLNGRLFMMVNSPIAKSKFSIMSFTMANGTRGVNLVGKDAIDPTLPDSYQNRANYTENRYTSASLSERLRLVYRDDILEASLGGSTRWSQSWYSITTQNVAAAWTSDIEGRVIANIPNIINFQTDLRYTFYNGYSAQFNEPMTVWNAEISKQILKNQATIAVRMYDILGQSRNVMRTMADNYVLDTMNNTLGRYFVVSFTWRFGKFGEGGSPMQRMMGGRGPGRGPGGPGRGGYRR